ncbi:hypothetical protein QZH41_006479 [Actinostola sp. cb2023]|nr:hypothetical protein QZH41_006479 [Actinostola sp. cb2023]
MTEWLASSTTDSLFANDSEKIMRKRLCRLNPLRYKSLSSVLTLVLYIPQARGPIGDSLDDSFFDLLSRCQGSRMNEQRCDAPDPVEDNSKSADDLLELVAKLQGDRMDEQRFELRDPEDDEGATAEKKAVLKLKKDRTGTLSDDLYEMVLRSQAHRIEDQRSEPPLHRQAPTVPDEDFFGLILRLQSNRMDDQRSSLPGGHKRYIQK